MPKTDEERLLVLVEARINDLEKNMAKASKTADRNYDRMRRSSRSATRGMERDMQRSTSAMNKALATTSSSVGAFGKAFVGGIIGGLTIGGLTAIASKVSDVASSVAEVGDQARIAGVNVEAFQELKYVAEQNRIAVDALTDGLKEMNLRADEFIFSQGKFGSGAEAFKRLGYDADTLAVKLEKPSELFAEIIGKLQKLDKAAQIRIADEIFGGTGGEQFVKLIAQGEDGIRDAIEAAHDLGAIMDEDLIDKAAELDRRFNDVATTVGTALKTAIVEAASAMGQFWDRFQEFQDRSTHSLKVRQAQLAHEHMELENELQRWRGQPDTPLRTLSINDITQRIEANRAKDAEITQLLNDRNSGGTTNLPPITVETESEPSKGRGRSKRDQEAARLEAERRALERYMQSLEDEARMLSMTEEQKRAFIAARNAGAAATEDEIRYVQELTESIHDQTEAQQQAAETAEFFKGIAVDSFAALIPVIDTGNDALDSLINKLIEATAQAALLGEGPLANLFGGGSGLLGGIFSSGTRGGGQLAIAKANVAAGLVTGLYANGTDFAPGGPAIVGERGPELVNLPRGAQVIPNHQMRAAGGGSSSTVNNINLGGISIAVPEGTRPDDAAAIGREVRRQLDQFSWHELPGRVQQIQRNPNRRG